MRAQDDDVRARLERLAALGARSAELAHELRNALAVLETSLHLVQRHLRGVDVRPEVERHLSRMAEQVHAGQALVREALGEVGGHGAERTHADLRALALEVVSGVARPDHVSVEVQLEVEHARVDARLLRQLLLNLVRNAVEAVEARHEARVAVRVRRDAHHLLLSVEDDGPGIAPEVSARLFEAFNSSKPNGTGLGLLVCRRIAEAHGGSIVARARRPRGTSMEVTIPLDDANA